MRRASAILGLVAVLLFAVLVRAQTGPDPADQAAVETPPASGMALIDDYRCAPGETRKVAVRGVEDGYSSEGQERAGMHPRLPDRYARMTHLQTDYDSRVPDRVLADWFELPGQTTSAMLVIRYRLTSGVLNDTLALGNLADNAELVSIDTSQWDTREGWDRHDDIHWVDLARAETPSGRSVIDIIRASPGVSIFDVFVQDDTSVDFMALAWCEAPPTRMGVTLHSIPVPEDKAPDVAAFECRPATSGEPDCKPFVGDQPCDSPMPMLCFRDLDLPRPPEAAFSSLTSRRWSGGEVAATEPIKASRFRTITDADRYCASRLGRDWRVAEWSAGGAGYGFAAKSGGRSFSGRYWIDIRGVPYGTCWSRDHDR